MAETVGAQLYEHFKAQGIRPREAAYKAGISYQYMIELLNGSEKMTDSARAKISRAFPDTAPLLLQLELPLSTPQKEASQ